jgi:aminoglycoside 3-N-acetyltransferase
VPILEGELVDAIEELGVAGAAVMVHASLRSFGAWVAYGADGIIDALLSSGCTVLVPSFVASHFGVVPPPHMRLTRNGCDYSSIPTVASAGPTAVFTPDCGLIDASMGVLPARLLARAQTRRGHHPLEPFAALGPKSEQLIINQDATDVYAPIRALIELDSWVLLIGVGLNRMTALHLAEQRAGRRLFIRWARNADGRVIMVETGSCSEGFGRLASILEPYVLQTTVRAATLAAYPSRQAVGAVAEAIAADQRLTWCASDSCIRCRDSTAGGPVESVVLG